MIKVNGYICTDQTIFWKYPIDLEVKHGGDMFCIIKIKDREVLVKAEELITALKAECGL